MIDFNDILYPNSAYERRAALQWLFNKKVDLSSEQVKILQNCETEEYESIGLIGAILATNDAWNIMRLIIGSYNSSNLTLSARCQSLLGSFKVDEEAFIDQTSEHFITCDALSDRENKFYLLFFGFLNRLQR